MTDVRLTSRIRNLWFHNSAAGENMTNWIIQHGGRLVYKIVQYEGGGESVVDYIEFSRDEDATAFRLRFDI